jgi:hypothetical protein
MYTVENMSNTMAIEKAVIGVEDTIGNVKNELKDVSDRVDAIEDTLKNVKTMIIHRIDEIDRMFILKRIFHLREQKRLTALFSLLSRHKVKIDQ